MTSILLRVAVLVIILVVGRALICVIGTGTTVSTSPCDSSITDPVCVSGCKDGIAFYGCLSSSDSASFQGITEVKTCETNNCQSSKRCEAL